MQLGPKLQGPLNQERLVPREERLSRGTLVQYVVSVDIRKTLQILSNKCLISDCRKYPFNQQFSSLSPI